MIALEVPPSRPIGRCAWCGCQAAIDVKLGAGEMVFFDGDLCHDCLAVVVDRYHAEDVYLEKLVSAGTPPKLIETVMRSRLVPKPTLHVS